MFSVQKKSEIKWHVIIYQSDSLFIRENLKHYVHVEHLYCDSKLIFLLHWYCTCNQASVSHFLLMISLCNSSITLKPEERGINCMWNEKPPVKYWFFAINCMVHEAQGIDSGVKLGCDFFLHCSEYYSDLSSLIAY